MRVRFFCDRRGSLEHWLHRELFIPESDLSAVRRLYDGAVSLDVADRLWRRLMRQTTLTFPS